MQAFQPRLFHKAIDAGADAVIRTGPHALGGIEIYKEIIDARIYCGMHYRTSGVHGSVMGRKAAQWIDKHYFLPVAQSHTRARYPARRRLISVLERFVRVSTNLTEAIGK